MSDFLPWVSAAEDEASTVLELCRLLRRTPDPAKQVRLTVELEEAADQIVRDARAIRERLGNGNDERGTA